MVNFLMVPLIMGCALFGTVGMLKIIKKVSPARFGQAESYEEKEKKNK